MSGRNRNFRKRRALEEQEQGLEEGDESPTELSLRDKLHGTKLLQKHRVRTKGLDASSLALGIGNTQDSETQTRAKAMLGDASTIDLSAAFNKEERVDKDAQDPHMKKYVEEELARMRGKELKDETEASNPTLNLRKEEEELYRVPEELRANKPADDSAGHPGNSWAAGIQEVSLSIDFKLKNIERTEAAKKALLEESAKRANIKDPLEEDNLPTNFKDIGANATRNMFVRQFGKDKWIGASGGGGNRNGRSNDDEAMAKFKRDQRARRRR